MSSIDGYGPLDQYRVVMVASATRAKHALVDTTNSIQPDDTALSDTLMSEFTD